MTPIPAHLLNPSGFSDLAEQVAKFVTVKPSDLSNPVIGLDLIWRFSL
jgi:hypothetical protein